MNKLHSIITTFSNEDQREFLAYLQKKNRRGDTKNVQLFKLIASGKTQNLDQILYGKPAKNAYHALCKRLQDSLIDFIASRSFAGETSEELEILKLLLASRIFFEHKQNKIAFKTLQKAERQALSLDAYSILTELYHTKIQYAHLNPSIELTAVIAASQKNMKLFQQEQQLNMAYAAIKAGLKSSTPKSVNELITDAFSHFDIELDKTLTYKALYQLMNITTSAARLQSDYYNISPFMVTIYEIISEKKSTANKHLFYHIEILNLMAMTHFRNKNFSASQEFTAAMEVAMQQKKGAYFNRFHEKLTLLQALNLNYTAKASAAIEILQHYPGQSLDIDLSLITLLFQQNRHSDAYQILKRMQHSDTWYEKKSGWIWVLKKNIIEILLLIELDRLELVDSRLQSFRHRFSKRLQVAGENRVLNFMELAMYYYDHPKEVTAAHFKERVETSFEWLGAEREDIFVMSFYAWIKSKMEEQNLYQTTLNLVAFSA